MKTLLRLAVATFALALLAGCASTHELTSTQPATQQPLTEQQLYMAHVENVAKRRGIQVTWVNAPRFPKDDRK
ncbi:hypothetical protein [Pseudoxanthomonas putridarboris]|uniref:Lipoprotein n=1 Tax=Pseudoxanthomonas putridarboris TaxID=752605 RepID=A0ABU9J3L1_9GAMM